MKAKVKSLSCVRPSATPWTVAFQAPPSMGFSRQEYWSGVLLPSLLEPLPHRKILTAKQHSSWRAYRLLQTMRTEHSQILWCRINDLGTMLHAQTMRNIHLVRKKKKKQLLTLLKLPFWYCGRQIMGWLKSLFEFFHKMLGKTQTNFLAKPIMVELEFILSYLS